MTLGRMWAYFFFYQTKFNEGLILVFNKGCFGNYRSLVVQTLKDRLYTSTNSEALAYFYCNRGDQQRAQPEVVMSTLVQQLASLRPGEQLQKVVVDEYRLRVKATGRPSPLNLTHGNALAQALCNIYPQTWIIVDALDECDENTRQLLIHRFLDLVKGCTSLVKIFVTSRLDSDITATLDSDAIFVRSISLHGENESSEVRGDMRHIVEGRVQKAFDEGGVLPGKLDKDKAQELKSEIIEILLTRGDRMYCPIFHYRTIYWALIADKPCSGPYGLLIKYKISASQIEEAIKHLSTF